jgi:hypothetical protein
MSNFKKGDKIRIKDGISSETHREQFPHFVYEMDNMKDKVLTIRGFTKQGCIYVEGYDYSLNPEWVTLVYGGNFKKGDKIRIKDEVSSKTHWYEPPHFIDSMDRFKDEVLTIKDFTKQGNIEVEGYEFCLNPEWVEPLKKVAKIPLMDIPEDISFDDFMELIFGESSTPAPEVDSILEEAQDILEGDRESDYGDPVANFNRISDIASSILNETITPEQCVVVMMAVKLSREQYRHKRDNLVDLVAYTEIYNRIKEQH